MFVSDLIALLKGKDPNAVVIVNDPETHDQYHIDDVLGESGQDDTVTIELGENI